MKVWIVQEVDDMTKDNLSHHILDSVFASKEKAEEYVAKQEAETMSIYDIAEFEVQ